MRGVGGTRNCDWWFTDEAVLIDTAGRYTTQEANAAVDAAAWDGFLALLKQDAAAPADQRRADHHQPPGPAAADAGRAQGARAQAARALQELHDELGVRPPVYVLVTKVDLIAGFDEIFGDLGKEEREQVWGFTFPLTTPSSPDEPAGRLRRASSRALRGAPARPLVRAHGAEHESLKRAAIFSFPQQFAA